MTNLLETQINEGGFPILCIFGGSNFLQAQIVSEYSKKFRIVLIAPKKPDFLDNNDVYFVALKDTALLPKLNETIDYSLIFMSETTRKYSSFLFEKIKKDKTQTLLLSSVDEFKENIETIKTFLELSRVRVSIYGEVLDKDLDKVSGPLAKVIENAIVNNEVRLTGNETNSVYGISVADFLDSISRLIFGNFKNDSLYFLFYKHPETILESAHLIARVEPDVRIHFSDSITLNNIISRGGVVGLSQNLGLDTSYIIEEKSNFENTIKDYFTNREKLLDNLSSKLKKRRGAKNKRRGRYSNAIGFGLASLFFGIFLFLFANLFVLGASVLLLQDSIANLKLGNFSRVAQQSRVANVMLSIIQPTADISFDLISVLDSEKKVQSLFAILQKTSELSELAGKTITTATKSPSLTEGGLSTLTSNLSYLFLEGQRLTLRTSNKDLSTQLKSTYSKLLSFSEILPIILGFEKPKNYLLLFQNDEELRPTGGFIGSIGDLTISNGLVTQLTVQDVYELDGQLKNHIEPHYVIRRYLQPHLYLRDSNFSLDFQETASTAALLYNLETKKRPDAVIAINLEVLRQILQITGPITLPNYNVTVTSDTVSQFLQSTIKENFFPGSTQKKDVLNALLTQLISKNLSNQKFYNELVKILPDLFENKEILVSFSDSSIQKLFSANLFGGEIKQRINTDPRTISDFLYINEANIGVNKANAYVSRVHEYNAMVGQGKLASKATVTLVNSSPQDAYKVYMRFAVPRGSILKQITINDEKQQTTPAIIDFKIYEATSFKAPSELEVEQSQKDNFTIFGFITSVDRGNKSTIVVEYENGATKALQTIATYSFNYIKQPGVRPYELTTSIDYPEGYMPVDTSADSYGKNFLEEQTTINKDYNIKIELQRKQR